MIPARTAALLAALLAAAAAQAVDIQRWHTKQGTQVLLVERRELPMVDYAVIFKGAGSTADPEGKDDTAAVTAQMLMRGTADTDEEAFNAKASSLGSALAGSSSHEYSSFGFRSLSAPDRLRPTAELFAGALSAPRFDPAVLKRLQDRAVLSLRQNESYPGYLAARATTRLNYPDHPYGKSARRTEAAIRAVTVADLAAFHRTHYAQNNAIVTIVGDIGRKEAEALVADTVGRLPERTGADTATPPVTVHGRQYRHVPFADSTQDIITISLPVLKQNDPDYFALLLGNYILGGGGFDSRLMKELRDRKGYTYGASSSFTAYAQPGPFTIEFATERKNSRAALKAAQQVLADFVRQGPTEAEMKQAKAYITGSFPLRIDTNGKLLANLADIGLYNRPADWPDSYHGKISALTAQEVKAAWQRHIRPDEMNVVLTGGQPETEKR